MENASFLNQKMKDIKEGDISRLIDELETIRPLTQSTMFYNYPLSHFLIQCLLTFDQKRALITNEELNGQGFLSQKIEKIKSPAILTLCNEIARRHNTVLEAHTGKKLFTFINAYFSDKPKKKKKLITI